MFLSKQKKYFILTPIILFVLIIIFFASYIILTIPKPRQDMEFGVTFSLKYTKDLGIDWQDAYNAILNDLEVKYLRLPIYWHDIEPSPGWFDFSKYDYMVDKAEKEGVEIIAVVGRRQPRWPECHVPAWAKGNSETVQQVNIKFAIAETINHFKNSPAIIAWQVDNEPLFSIFGLCPKPDFEFIKQEINLVRTLDPARPIMITDSGELSTWLRTSSIADILGISMYRVTWNKNFGFWYYPLSPKFYQRHAKAVSKLVDKAIITELQAEPWFSKPIPLMTLKEQYKSMNPERFWRNIDFARRTQFDQAYLWGVEWWYWLKENKNDSTMWETAKELFVD